MSLLNLKSIHRYINKQFGIALSLISLALSLFLLFHRCRFDIHFLIQFLTLESDTFKNLSATFNTKSIVTVSGKNCLPIQRPSKIFVELQICFFCRSRSRPEQRRALSAVLNIFSGLVFQRNIATSLDDNIMGPDSCNFAILKF